MNSGPGLEPHENAQAFTPESPEFVHCTHREHARYMDGGQAFVCPPVPESTCAVVIPKIRGQGRAGTTSTECY